MALNTQVSMTIVAQMTFMLAALGCMAGGTGHHLHRPWIENFFADRMGKLRVPLMANFAGLIDRSLGHVRKIGPMRRMTV